MKAIFLISIGFIVLSNSVSSQCPQSGLKIQSANCDQPKNLMVSNISCPSVNVSWRGNKTQTYIVKATYTNPETNNTVIINGTDITCDVNGNCSATIAVNKEGTNLSWSIQAVCSQEGAIFYSPEVSGKNVLIPMCNKITDKILADKPVHIYPNPAHDYLMVEYHGKITESIEFSIFDITGKKVFEKTKNSGIKSSNYSLDVRKLLAGTYVLKIRNGLDVKQAKFVIIHNNKGNL